MEDPVRAIGAEMAKADYDGGYRTLPSDDAAEGCVYPPLKRRLGVQSRTDPRVSLAIDAYHHKFINLLAHSRRRS